MKEEDHSDAFKWPNERMLWVRFVVCTLVGAMIALGIVIGGVMIVDEIISKFKVS